MPGQILVKLSRLIWPPPVTILSTHYVLQQIMGDPGFPCAYRMMAFETIIVLWCMRPYEHKEAHYHFQSIERLVEDSRNDCVRLADWEW